MYEGYKNYAFNKKSKIFEPADDKSVGTDGKKRYFVSIMSESLIKKNVFFGFRKRTRVCLLRMKLTALHILIGTHSRTLRAFEFLSASREEGSVSVH